MGLISFGYRVDMYAPSLLPTDPAGYIVAYDLQDGILKQKNHEGLVTLVGAGAGGPQGPPGPVGPAGLTWSGPWIATQSYFLNYAVGYASASWWCISGVTGATGNDGPDIDTTHWALLAAQGSPGSQGGQGEHGLDGPQGTTGPAGATGPAGDTGPVGATGATGEIGTVQLTITAPTNFVASDLISGLSQNGRHVIIDNGANNISVDIDVATTTSYQVVGTGTVTFTATASTLQSPSGAVINTQYGTAAVSYFNTSKIVLVNNV